MTVPKLPKFKFCPFCKAKMRTKKEGGVRREYCPKDGYVHYSNPTPAAGVVIVKGGKVLLVKRKFDPHKGLWQVPAGFVEWYETPQETAVKETKEETGLDVKVLRLFDVRKISEDPREMIVLILYEAKIVGGKIRAGDDAEEVKWWPLQHLPRFGSREHKKALEKLLS